MHTHTHPTERRNSRIGLVLFFIYLIIYGAFVWLSAFDAEFMASHAVAGVNVAVAWGFGLIVGALVLALIYLRACNPVEHHHEHGHGEEQK